MERTRSTRRGGRAGRDAGADDAHGQTDQCRVPDLSLDAGCQYHDGRAWHGADAASASFAGIVSPCERANAVTASAIGDGPDAGDRPDAGGGQKTGCAKSRAPDQRTGSACARRAGSRRASAISGERLMLSKADAGR